MITSSCCTNQISLNKALEDEFIFYFLGLSVFHNYSHCHHYNDVIMGAIASQTTSLTIVFSIVYLGTDQRKHQSSVPLAFVRGIHRRPMTSNAENVSIWRRHHDKNVIKVIKVASYETINQIIYAINIQLFCHRASQVWYDLMFSWITIMKRVSCKSHDGCTIHHEWLPANRCVWYNETCL